MYPRYPVVCKKAKHARERFAARSSLEHFPAAGSRVATDRPVQASSRLCGKALIEIMIRGLRAYPAAIPPLRRSGSTPRRGPFNEASRTKFAHIEFFAFWPGAVCEGRAERVCSAPEVRPQLVLLSRGRRRSRCRDIGRYSRSWCAPEGAARLAGYRFGGKSKLPWSGEWNASRTGLGPVQCQRSSEI